MLSQIHRFDHLCPSRLSAQKSSVTRSSSRGEQNTMGNPLSLKQCLTNFRTLKGKAAVLQIDRNNSKRIPSSFWREQANGITFWMMPSLPMSPLTNVPCTQAYAETYTQASKSSKNQTDGSWAARILCSQIKLLYTVHITLDSLA